MPNAFKGTRIDVDWFQVTDTAAGPKVEYRILYRDGDGVVHGTMRHEHTADAGAVGAAVKALSDALAAQVASLHFSDADPSTRGKGPHAVTIESDAGAAGGDIFPQSDP